MRTTATGLHDLVVQIQQKPRHPPSEIQQGNDSQWPTPHPTAERPKTDEIKHAYPVRCDGRVMLKFPRLFIVAVR
jgi:hypothetical protein